MRIALAQFNPVVGDVAGNCGRILSAIASARAAGAAFLMTPELSLIGYPPRDLLFREGVVAACMEAVETIAGASQGLTVLVGHPFDSASLTGRYRNSV